MARPIQSYLDTLIAHHMPELSGAEFKIAVYLYRCLRRRGEVTTTIDSLAKATGLSWRQTQSAARSLAKKAILRVDSRQKRGTRCRLPAELERSRARKQKVRSKATLPSLPPKQSPLPPLPSMTTQPGPVLTKLSPPTAARQDVVKAPLQVALAPPAPKELEAAAKTYQARTIASTLMDRRRLIALEEFDMLLQCADGVIDRLLARLQKLLKQGSRFDNPLHLGAEIRTMVLVR